MALDSEPKHPIQPLLVIDDVVRFKSNRIVRMLLDTHPTMDLNTIAGMGFSNEDRQQLAQLIGYSLSGYGELTDYVTDEAYEAATESFDTGENNE